ncbi:MAG: helix-turn-helix domain-containing protein [Firmicutes bacterium]|nr:helix-turn-helix domain-containing protein [Bacillota bacterium]
MAVFRIEKTRDYTVMSNHHLRNTNLSLKAKGLLSLMLSLPENWDYTTKGLARICKDGVDSICAGVRELEEQGYVIRERVRNSNGQLGAIEYTILEQPRPPEREKPERENPVQVNPILDSPVLGKPEQGNPAQLNTKESSKQKSKTDLSSTEISNPIQSNPQPLTGLSPAGAGMGTDGMGAREIYREIVLDNIGYEYLIQDSHIDREQLDEIAELIVDTVCSARKTIRIAGDDYPAEAVKARFMKLDSSHVQSVMDCMRENTTYVRNIKKYLLAALYNAPGTISNYYSSLGQHDMYGDGKRGRG